MSIVTSVFILLLVGVVVIALLLLSVEIMFEGAIEMITLAITKSKQLEQKNGKVVNKLTKVEMQVESILKRQHF